MEFNLELIKSHPYATGAIVIVGAAGLYILTRSGGEAAGSGGGSSAYDVQLAQIAAATGVQSTHDQAAVQIASLQAGVANGQTQAAVESYKVQGDTAVQLAKIQTEADLQKSEMNTELQGLLFSTMFQTARDEQISNNELSKFVIGKQYDLAQSGVSLAKMGDRRETGANIVALALGQGNIASYNQSTASSNIASSMMWGNIISSLAGAATGLFGMGG